MSHVAVVWRSACGVTLRSSLARRTACPNPPQTDGTDAMMDLTDGAPPRECVILDISQGDARLPVGPLPVTENFTLLLSANGSVRRACKVAWRREDEIGVEFL
jgi:PilZ domain-containing protein